VNGLCSLFDHISVDAILHQNFLEHHLSDFHFAFDSISFVSLFDAEENGHDVRDED